MNRTRMLMLTTALVSGVYFCGVQAWAQQSQFPYCQLLQVPMPDKSPAPGLVKPVPAKLPAAVPPPAPITTGAPGNVPLPTAPPAQTPGAGSQPATITGAPPATPADAKDVKDVKDAKPIPNIVDLMKKSTDAKAIVSTILDAAAPRTSDDFDDMYAQMYNEIAQIYIEPSDLIKAGVPAYKHKYDGKMKTWGDYTEALKDLFHQIGNRWTYIHDPSEMLAYQIGQAQNLVDFGASLHLRDDGQFEIEFLEPGTSAQLNHFREGDLITSVNGKPLKGLTKEAAENLLRKSEGDQIEIKSIQDRNPVEGLYTLHSAPDDANAANADLIHNNLAYVKLPSFMDTDGFSKLMSKLVVMEMTTPGGLQGMILDLRYNGGGMVDMAKQLIQTLMNDGVILHEKKRMGADIVDETTTVIPQPEIMRVGDNPAQLVAVGELKKLPLVILINGSTASAAEITTGSLREARPNTETLGERSFGKFEEMAVLKTPNCGEAAILSGMYTTPLGHWWQGLGITPDMVVHQPRDSNDDAQMAAAVKWLVDKTALNSANIVTMTPDSTKILGTVVDKPLEPKISTLSQWMEANMGQIELYCTALVLLLIGLGLVYTTRPSQKKADE
jgi:C-terminal processing protease CtpA/Prc